MTTTKKKKIRGGGSERERENGRRRRKREKLYIRNRFKGTKKEGEIAHTHINYTYIFDKEGMHKLY